MQLAGSREQLLALRPSKTGLSCPHPMQSGRGPSCEEGAVPNGQLSIVNP
jgi:hypothetical protein